MLTITRPILSFLTLIPTPVFVVVVMEGHVLTVLSKFQSSRTEYVHSGMHVDVNVSVQEIPYISIVKCKNKECFGNSTT